MKDRPASVGRGGSGANQARSPATSGSGGKATVASVVDGGGWADVVEAESISTVGTDDELVVAGTALVDGAVFAVEHAASSSASATHKCRIRRPQLLVDDSITKYSSQLFRGDGTLNSIPSTGAVPCTDTTMSRHGATIAARRFARRVNNPSWAE
jgi:hypothetical protein